MSTTEQVFDDLMRSLSEEALRHVHEMNRRRAAGLVDDAGMREFGTSVRGIVHDVLKKTDVGELTVAQLREVARSLMERAATELERRQQERGRPN